MLSREKVPEGPSVFHDYFLAIWQVLTACCIFSDTNKEVSFAAFIEMPEAVDIRSGA